jgi:soluble lytic murein transglycosylase-like protein
MSKTRKQRERIKTGIMAVGLILVWTVILAWMFVVWAEEPAAPAELHVERQTVIEAKALPDVADVEALVKAAEMAKLYDVPLDAELQFRIIGLCEERGIDPAIVMAMIWKESRFHADSVGDGGNSLGLMQVQPRWHSKRMEKLGCDDLLDPHQNVVVGIDYLAACISRYDGDVAKALVAYNQGHYNGTVTAYAKSVLAKAEEMRGAE